MSYHRLLQKQINKFLSNDISNRSDMENLLAAVNDSYNSYERDKELADRASNISEDEYIEINKKLNDEVVSKRHSIQQLKESFLSITGEEIETKSDDLAKIVQYLVNEIDNRKNTEQALTSYKKFSEDILINIPADIAVFDKSHNYIFINQKGVANAEIRQWLIGKNDFDYCEFKGIDNTMAITRRNYFNKCIEIRNKVEWVDKHKTTKGEYQYILRMFYPYFENDELKFVIGYGVDISEKIEFERMLTKAVLKTQEDERLEIGTELHDNVCQILTGVHMGLSMIKKSLINTDTKWFDYCDENITLALKEARNLSHRLSPVFFEEVSFYISLKKMIDNFNAADKYNITFSFDNKVNKLVINPDIQLNLFRILQEELRNIYKYANATEIKIGVLIEDNFVVMRTKDNGVGFNINEVVKGNGMANIKRRVEILDGDLKIESSIGEGCEIIAKVPLNI